MNKKIEDIDIFQSMFKSSMEGILVVDADGIIIKANPALEIFFGYSIGELEEQKVESLIPKKFKKISNPIEEKFSKKPIARQMGQTIDLWGLKKNGSQFPLEISLSPALINDRQVIVAFVFDITDKKAKDVLFRVRNNALASTSNGIIITDAQNQNQPIIYSNDAFTKITGYTQEEVLGKNCSFLQNGDRDQKEIGIMKNAIINGEACNVKVRNYRKDGSLFWNDITITPIINKENKLTHFIGVQNEVTNKVKQESLKNQTRKYWS